MTRFLVDPRVWSQRIKCPKNCFFLVQKVRIRQTFGGKVFSHFFCFSVERIDHFFEILHTRNTILHVKIAKINILRTIKKIVLWLSTLGSTRNTPIRLSQKITYFHVFLRFLNVSLLSRQSPKLQAKEEMFHFLFQIDWYNFQQCPGQPQAETIKIMFWGTCCPVQP